MNFAQLYRYPRNSSRDDASFEPRGAAMPNDLDFSRDYFIATNSFLT